MSKLHQIIALCQSRKSAGKRAMTDVYNKLQNGNLFKGLEKEYTPRDEDGQRLPAQSQKVSFTVEGVLSEFQSDYATMIDTVIAQDKGNQKATANIVVSGKTIASNVPATTLIFLEKQMVDLLKLVETIPTLSPTAYWSTDENSGLSRSDTQTTVRTQKVPTPIVKYAATEHHPAQTEIHQLDVISGEWATTEISGEMSPVGKRRLVRRVKELKDAIVAAREEANSVEVENTPIGQEVLNYIFG